MCLIIKKPPGRHITSDFLENVHTRNQHGWGYFYLCGGELVWARGMSLGTLIDANRRLPEDAEAYIHLRQATYGDVVEDMAHPFLVRRGLLLMHNGSLHSLAPPDAARSDTHELARLLADLTDGLDDDAAVRLLRSEGFARLTAPLLHGSMIVLLDRAGTVCLGRGWHTVAPAEWSEAMAGIEVSNTHAWHARNAPTATPELQATGQASEPCGQVLPRSTALGPPAGVSTRGRRKLQFA